MNWAYDAINSEDYDWPSSVKDDNDENWKNAKESWNKLGLDKQWSNRNFVDNIEVKKRSFGMNVIEKRKKPCQTRRNVVYFWCYDGFKGFS